MRLRVLELAEYAAFTDDKKLIVNGVYTSIHVKRKRDAPPDAKAVIAMPPGYLVWVVEASLGEGLKHQVALCVRDEDGEKVLESSLGSMEFHLDKHGRPMRFQGRLTITGLPLPGPGDYEFQLLVGGEKIGEVGLYVDDVTPTTV